MRKKLSLSVSTPMVDVSKIKDLVLAGQKHQVDKLLREASNSNQRENAQHIASLAREFMASGDADAAIKLANSALGLDPHNKVIALNLALWAASYSAPPSHSKQIIERWSRKFLDPLFETSTPWSSDRRAFHPRLRVGYVSGDLNNHPTRFFIEPIFIHHNKFKFEIHAFMTGESDVFTDRLRPLVEHWHDVRHLGDVHLLNLIRRLEIDVLVDLSGHTNGQRLEVFAMRAAPVQITWFGYMQTLGMQAMNWRISDWEIAPPGSEIFYTERLLRISSHYAFMPPVNMQIPPPLPAQKNGFVTMVCLNDNRKVSDQSLALWSKVLENNPNSGLIVISFEHNEVLAEHSFRPRLRKFGLPDNRVTVVPRLNFQSYLNLSSIADFALDTTPVSGGTTTLLGASVGLPTLCLNKPGLGPLSSLSSGLMRHIKLDECIALREDQFVARASAWINDLSTIEHLRDRCLRGLSNSALLRHREITDELERAFIECFQQV